MKELGKACRPGHVYRACSKRFGTADILCVKVPDMAEKSIRFVNLDHIQHAAYYHSSCSSDEVVQEWTNLRDYFNFKDKEKENESHNIQNNEGKPGNRSNNARGSNTPGKSNRKR